MLERHDGSNAKLAVIIVERLYSSNKCNKKWALNKNPQLSLLLTLLLLSNSSAFFIIVIMIIIIIVISHAPVTFFSFHFIYFEIKWLTMYVGLAWNTSGSSVHPTDLPAKPSIVIHLLFVF